VSILFCGNDFIQDLNARYRHKDESTDVLSFPAGGVVEEDGEQRYIAGDIVVSLPALAANASVFTVSEDEELRRLLMHGVLHLDGYNHSINDLSDDALQHEPMLALQEALLAKLNDATIL
jgi:probable rRNA maturation factor